MAMLEKVGVYCRLSDEDRDKLNKNDDSDSIVNQRSMCLKFANQNGWNVVDIYSDDDFSGAGTYRPDFERLIKDCESGKINLVLCKSQSRFSRDMSVIENYLHNKFIEWGVRFVSIVDNADTNIEANKKSRQINGLINEWYLDDLSQNIRKSLKNKRDDGLYMGSFAPYGYEKDKEGHKLIVDPVASEVVKKIFEMYANGNGYLKICEYLNDHNIPTRAVYKKQKGSKFVCPSCNLETVRWNSDTIAQILSNEVYIGNLVQGKSTYVSYKNHKKIKVSKKDWSRKDNAHEPVVDKETWDKVQKILGKHAKSTSTGEIHFFSKKVYCSCCNKVFVRNVYTISKKEGNTIKAVYLQCKGNKKYKICDNNRSIRLDELEKVILNALNELLDSYYDKDYLKKSYDLEQQLYKKNKNTINALEKEKRDIEKKIELNKEYYKNLYEDKVTGIITDEMFIMLSNDYLKQIENLSKRLDAVEKEINNYNSLIADRKIAEEIIKKYRHIKKLDKTIIDEFINTIYIGKLDEINNTRDIEIEWNFQF